MLQELLHGYSESTSGVDIDLEESDSEVEEDSGESADEFSIPMDENQNGDEEWKVEKNGNGVESSCGETFIDDSINSSVNVNLPANWRELSAEEIARATGIAVSDLQDSNDVLSSDISGIEVPQHQQQSASKRPPLIPEDWRAMRIQQFKEMCVEINAASGLTLEDLDDIEISS